MTREEYESLRNDVLDRIKDTASGIMSGNIRIRPFKDGKRLVCNNCSYKPICKRDREYVRNTGWELPPEPKPEPEF
jgi:ATP-dependent helicase/nuclease subunit B